MQRVQARDSWNTPHERKVRDQARERGKRRRMLGRPDKRQLRYQTEGNWILGETA
jgi:hypothetical protein